jgi:hypothetical protein
MALYVRDGSGRRRHAKLFASALLAVNPVLSRLSNGLTSHSNEHMSRRTFIRLSAASPEAEASNQTTACSWGTGFTLMSPAIFYLFHLIWLENPWRSRESATFCSGLLSVSDTASVIVMSIPCLIPSDQRCKSIARTLHQLHCYCQLHPILSTYTVQSLLFPLGLSSLNNLATDSLIFKFIHGQLSLINEWSRCQATSRSAHEGYSNATLASSN